MWQVIIRSILGACGLLWRKGAGGDNFLETGFKARSTSLPPSPMPLTAWGQPESAVPGRGLEGRRQRSQPEDGTHSRTEPRGPWSSPGHSRQHSKDSAPKALPATRLSRSRWAESKRMTPLAKRQTYSKKLGQEHRRTLEDIYSFFGGDWGRQNPRRTGCCFLKTLALKKKKAISSKARLPHSPQGTSQFVSPIS